MPLNLKLDLASRRGRRIGRTFRRDALEATWLFSAAIGAAALAASAAEDVTPPEFRREPPMANVRVAAKAAQMALEGWEEPGGRLTLRTGDQVTALVTLSEGKTLKQWVITLAAEEPENGEARRPRAESRIFSSSGYEFRFGSEPTPLALRMIGPFTEADQDKKIAAPELKQRRISVSGDFLGLGLYRLPATALRTRAMRAANPDLKSGTLELGPRPYPPKQAAEVRPLAEAAGIFEADERALAGGALALLEFFQTASRTPGLQEVLLSVIDVPWWSMVRSGGKVRNVHFEPLPLVREFDREAWGLPVNAKVYSHSVRLRLNGEPALLCQLAVTEPRPPLLVSAGIVGLVAGRPDGKGPVLMLEIVAARAARAGGDTPEVLR